MPAALHAGPVPARSSGPPRFAAFTDLRPNERRAFVACLGGITLDGMDNAFLGLILPALALEWHLTKAETGSLATLSLLAASAGGWLAGALSDRFGRMRMLQISILWFSVFSLVCAFAQTPLQLASARALAALGFGGELAVAIALVGEISRAASRATLLGAMHSTYSIGAALASLCFFVCFSLLPPDQAWRVLFAIGVLPALLVLYMRRSAVELPRAARVPGGAGALAIFRPKLLLNTILGTTIATGTLGGIAGVQLWLPTYLVTVRDLSIFGTTANVALYQVSHFIGYLVGGPLADRWGRRLSFILSSLLSMAAVLAYTLAPVGDMAALAITVPLGFFTATIYGGMAALFAEIYPTAIRGSGVAFCYNCGRALGAFLPALIGLASQSMPLATALALFAGGVYGIVVLVSLFVPETRGAEL